MLDFNKYLARHGEFGVQALIEQIERYSNVQANIYTPLEERWNAVMQANPMQQYQSA
jgi:hypothetical protein